jgi:N-acetylmuramoyl-L-alanine amidase
VLHAHRRDVVLDSVNHWLNFPVATASGRLWVSKVDVLKTLDPVLRPAQFRGPSRSRLVVLDPGHGGGDRGTRGRTGRTEKSLTLDLAKRVESRLLAAGLAVALTRTTDRTLALSDRAEFARRKQADLFVSLHFNAALGGVRGIETYSLTPVGAPSTAGGAFGRDRLAGHRHDEENLWLAHCVQKSLLRLTAAPDRGVRRARFQVLREAPCPAILVEAGFLSSSIEERKILTADYRDLLAKAIAEGILAYKRSTE